MVIINIIDEEKEHLKRENKQLKHELLKVRDENEFLQRAFRMVIGQEPKKIMMKLSFQILMGGDFYENKSTFVL